MKQRTRRRLSTRDWFGVVHQDRTGGVMQPGGTGMVRVSVTAINEGPGVTRIVNTFEQQRDDGTWFELPKVKMP